MSLCPEIKWDKETYAVIRSVSKSGNQASQCWHFDNLRETALIVLRSTESGDLMIRPRLRKPPKSLFMYAFTKILWTNPITWFFLRRESIRDKFFTKVILNEGDVMIFDGSTTYHGNLPVSSGMRRSILLHRDQLFPDSWITKLFHKLNEMHLYKKELNN